ncbi:hypothetical protein [Brevundimonas sp.]|jgi:hypothetical protein|uniref:hypothetical protein n=1 Tax=Brevundimonas sp. TaxID=1871086 RepID=UPI003783485F
MAFTILQQPLQYTPVYNDINFVVSSTNNTQPNFNYIFDVKINGVFISRHRIPARPDNGYGLFNAKRIAETYISQSINFDQITVTNSSESILSLVIECREEFGTTPAPGSILATSTAVFCWNAVFPYPTYVNYTVSLFRQMTNEINVSYLLSDNLINKIKLTEKGFISVMVGEAGAVNEIGVFAYNSSGTLIKSTYILNPFYNVANTASRFITLPAGPVNLNQILNANLNATTQNQGVIIPSTTAYYEIRTYGNLSASKIYRYNITEVCSKHTPVRLHFLNRLGGYDSFTFDLLNTFTSNIERKEYRQNLGGFVGSTYTYDIKDRSATIFDTQIKTIQILNSNWITDTEAGWLEQLMTSPDVYVEVGTQLQAVNITDTSYTQKKTVNDQLFNLTITIEKSFLKQRQRG